MDITLGPMERRTAGIVLMNVELVRCLYIGHGVHRVHRTGTETSTVRGLWGGGWTGDPVRKIKGDSVCRMFASLQLVKRLLILTRLWIVCNE